MGYTTEYYGSVSFDPPISRPHREYINAFSATRRMKRRPELLSPNPTMVQAGVPVGEEGCYMVGRDSWGDPSIVDYNREPDSQPCLWCQWIIDEDGDLVWDGGEKFYFAEKWLEYLIEHFFKPWGYTLNGEFRYQGENYDDRGVVKVKDNIVSEAADIITNPLMDEK